VLGHPVMVIVVRLRVRFAGTELAVMLNSSVGHRHSRADPRNQDLG